MEKETGDVWSSIDGKRRTLVHTHSHIMKSHKDLKEQSAFVFVLLNRPNPHMLYCPVQL